MSVAGRRRRNQIDGQFSWRLIKMQESPGYRVLSLSARRVLDRIEIELAQHGGNENGKLPVRFDDFEDYGIHRHAIAPAIREVVALRFVEITEVGHSGADVRTVSKYRLTYRPTDAEKPTNEWKSIETFEQATALASAARAAKSEHAVALGRLAHERREQRKTEKPVSENAKISAGIRH
jgi:hypothetical protein